MDDRLAIRLGLLRLARRQRSLDRAAWAAARLRLRDVTLNAGDAQYAHDALGRLGRAIRLARVRRGHETGHELMPMSFAIPTSWWDRRRVARAVIAAVALAGLLAFFLLPSAPSLGDRTPTGGGSAAASASRPNPSPLRGRTQQLVAILPVPTAAPTVRPEPGATGAGGVPGGSGTGGAGGGSGTAVGVGTGTGTGVGGEDATPTPKPTVMLLSITVTDASTRIGLPGVCVIYGSVTCAIAPITDQNGNAMLRLSVGQLWHLQFARTGYVSQQVDVTSDAASKAIAVALVPIR